MDSIKIRLAVPAHVDISRITGPADSILRALEKASGCSILVRGDGLSLCGDPNGVEHLARVISDLFSRVSRGHAVSASEACDLYFSLAACASSSGPHDDVILMHKGRAVRPKTVGQGRYVDAIRSNTVTFGIGPAGTGKTYLAMALAVCALKRREVGRIVLTRPVVEAGENLGFLPGTLEEKIDPYMRPLLDALCDLVDPDRAREYIDRGLIEIAPLAYMRGRTLNDAFVILDEAQNTTSEQMKMFLTRLGFNSRFVITGDASQRDLPGREGALTEVERILHGVDDVSFIHLGRGDVVRHHLVGRIVEAYDAYEEKREGAVKTKGGERHGRSHQ